VRKKKSRVLASLGMTALLTCGIVLLTLADAELSDDGADEILGVAE